MDLTVSAEDDYLPHLKEIVETAQRTVPFYSRLYNGILPIDSMDQFAELPGFNEGMLIRERLGDMVADLRTVYEVCSPFGSMVSDSCMPRVQSLEDLEEQYCILEWIIITCIGITPGEDHPSIALVADERGSYGAGILSKMMILLLRSPFFGLVVRGHTAGELLAELSLFKPDIVLAAASINRSALPDSVRTVIDICSHPLSQSDGQIRFNRLLTHPLLGLIGCSSGTPGVYQYNSDHYYCETSPEGMIIYTSFMQKFMPIIRMRSRHWGRVIKPGYLEITYTGTH